MKCFFKNQKRSFGRAVYYDCKLINTASKGKSGCDVLAIADKSKLSGQIRSKIVQFVMFFLYAGELLD
jgi:hypothetical protein